MYLNKKKISVGGVLLGCLIAYVLYAHYHPKHPLAVSNITAPTVRTQVIQPVLLPVKIQVIGRLKASSVNITAEVGGHVKWIFFREGQFVKQGALLIQLDEAIYKAKYASAVAQFNLSQAEYRRTALLSKQGVIAKAAMDKAKANLKEKRALMQEEVMMLNKMRLRAPFSGMVGESQVTLGDYVTVGQPLVSLTDTEHLRVQYRVLERYFPFLTLRQKVEIQTTTYPNQLFSGIVSFVSPTIDLQSDTVLLYADVEDRKNCLVSGMFVNVTQLLSQKKNTIMIPTRALIPLLEGQQVYKIVDHRAYTVNVRIGQCLKGEVEIIHGLAVGDRIVTDGQIKISNGVQVMEIDH